MKENHLGVVSAVMKKVPDWVRHDLSSKDEGLRARAEETIAAMISAAVANATSAEGNQDPTVLDAHQ